MVKPSLYFPKREITSRLAKRCWEFSHKNFFVPNGQSSQSVDRHPQQYSGSERASSLSGVHYTTKYRRPTVLGWAFSFVPSPAFAELPAICVCQPVPTAKGTYADKSHILPLLLELLLRTLTIWHTQNALINNRLYLRRIGWFVMLIA